MLGKYQREQMMQGLERSSSHQSKGRAIMNALHILQTSSDPSQNKMRFEEFVADPFGHEEKKKEEERLKWDKIDLYTK